MIINRLKKYMKIYTSFYLIIFTTIFFILYRNSDIIKLNFEQKDYKKQKIYNIPTSSVLPTYENSIFSAINEIIFEIRPLIRQPPYKYIHPNITGYNPQHSGHFSQYNQSIFLDKYLGKLRNGFFIECGASDGRVFSNSLFFELKRNWTGLLIEASSTLYQKLLTRNRNVYSINTCLSPKKNSVMVNFTMEGTLLGYANYEPEEFIENRIRNEIPINTKNQRSIPMKCYPLFEILMAIGRIQIDLLSLDIEGSELDVLETIPFNIVNIRLILVEFFSVGRTKDRAKNIEDLDSFFEKTNLYRKVTKLRTDLLYERIE